jgi:hypothetical protein
MFSVNLALAQLVPSQANQALTQDPCGIFKANRNLDIGYISSMKCHVENDQIQSRL